MPAHPPVAEGEVLRHFTVAVFVVHEERVLLHFHRRLGRWLPPGGHIEDNELPDEAAERETYEETGIRIRLAGARGLPLDRPQQLVVPVGVQVEDIYPGHQHVDLVYFAVPARADAEGTAVHPSFVERDRVGWHSLDALEALGVDEEIRLWSARAVREVTDGVVTAVRRGVEDARVVGG